MAKIFRFHISRQRAAMQIADLRSSVRHFMRYAPNQGGDETPRENMRSAFFLIRSRLNRDYSITQAISELENVTLSLMDM